VDRVAVDRVAGEFQDPAVDPLSRGDRRDAERGFGRDSNAGRGARAGAEQLKQRRVRRR
jgi:hypothetical protein